MKFPTPDALANASCGLGLVPTNASQSSQRPPDEQRKTSRAVRAGFTGQAELDESKYEKGSAWLQYLMCLNVAYD